MGDSERVVATAGAVLEDAYGIEDRCMRCERPIERDRIRVIPPRYVQERDPYVRAGIVRRRVMCLGCYSRLDRNRNVARFARGPAPGQAGMPRRP